MQSTYTPLRPHSQARIPANPARRLPSAPRLTGRQLLEKQAQGRNAMAASEAQISAPYYRVVAFDPYTNVASIQKRGQASVIHNISLNTGECDCVLQEAVNKINGKLLAERSEVCCVGKCRRLIDHLEIADPYCLMNAPLAVDPFADLFASEAK